jgi:hypothetical protein
MQNKILSENIKNIDLENLNWEEFLVICKLYANCPWEKLPPGTIDKLSAFYMSKQSPEIQNKYHETLTIFDKRENVLGGANYLFVHTFGYIYSGSSVFIYNRDTNKFILQKRSAQTSWANQLDCGVGGCITYPIATEKARLDHVRQEIAEELFSNKYFPKNIKITKLGKTYYEITKAETIKRQFSHVYLAQIDNKLAKKIKPNEEVSALINISKADFLNLPKNELAPGLFFALRDIDLEQLP